MTPDEYQQAAISTLVTKTQHDTIMMCALGLAGESGEVCDHVKKVLFHQGNRPLNEAKTAEELGDIIWYVANMAHAIGFDLEAIMQVNIDKLAKRHKPNGEATGFQSFYASDSGDSLKISQTE